MSEKSAYILDVRSLPYGQSTQQYHITKELFDGIGTENEQKGFEDIISADITADVMIDKSEKLISLIISCNGTIEVVCDRCLDPLDVEIACEDNLYIKFGGDEMRDGDDVIVLDDKETKVDLAQYLYEIIITQKPYRCVHGENGEGQCNENMMAILEKQCKKDYDKEEIDPRWTALQKLK
ncbi:MAG: DUF177 domain-containing protein [Bacteroidales bacterium]|jgi:uncharacterized metal-binding protein YceD (DUF177 family)|nr:DUF177 domain-containing protein [Bacteroidales bacterium]